MPECVPRVIGAEKLRCRASPTTGTNSSTGKLSALHDEMRGVRVCRHADTQAQSAQCHSKQAGKHISSAEVILTRHNCRRALATLTTRRSIGARVPALSTASIGNSAAACIMRPPVRCKPVSTLNPGTESKGEMDGGTGLNELQNSAETSKLRLVHSVSFNPPPSSSASKTRAIPE